MNMKGIMLVMVLIVFAFNVIADPPSLPTITISPSVAVTNPSISCSGSIDPEGDPFNYTIILNPDNQTTAESYLGSGIFMTNPALDGWNQAMCSALGNGWHYAVINNATCFKDHCYIKAE